MNDYRRAKADLEEVIEQDPKRVCHALTAVIGATQRSSDRRQVVQKWFYARKRFAERRCAARSHTGRKSSESILTFGLAGDTAKLCLKRSTSRRTTHC